MNGTVTNKVTVCIVNYKTLEFTKLCLRSIRKYTSYPYQVLVVDNNSQDESLEYLRSLNWIQLVERDTSNDRSGGQAHAAALDLGLRLCNTEFFMSMHSDVFVRQAGWLRELVGYFGSDNNVSCVGSDKIELTPYWQRWLKKTTDLRTFKRKLLKKPDPLGKYRYYNRTICALYRTAILKKESLTFQMGQERGLTAGKKLYFELVDRNYPTVELQPSLLERYIIHLAHATQVINPQEFDLRKKTTRKTNRIIRKVMDVPEIQELLTDDSLDSRAMTA